MHLVAGSPHVQRTLQVHRTDWCVARLRAMHLVAGSPHVQRTLQVHCTGGTAREQHTTAESHQASAFCPIFAADLVDSAKL
ncbi:MAG: hypothetical protein DCC55_11805 [Chloroflexi bacterium]|nr:MAG: hypothetical protein DCC55_11805 [Chloroflexota bacterium]